MHEDSTPLFSARRERSKRPDKLEGNADDVVAVPVRATQTVFSFTQERKGRKKLVRTITHERTTTSKDPDPILNYNASCRTRRPVTVTKHASIPVRLKLPTNKNKHRHRGPPTAQANSAHACTPRLSIAHNSLSAINGGVSTKCAAFTAANYCTDPSNRNGQLRPAPDDLVERIRQRTFLSF